MAEKDKKPGKITMIGKRLTKFYVELRAELKKVVWPDRKKLTQSTIAVVGICLFAAILIFSIDQILSGFLGLVKFFPETASSTATVSNLLPTTAPGLTITLPPSSSVISGLAASTATSSAATSSASAS